MVVPRNFPIPELGTHNSQKKCTAGSQPAVHTKWLNCFQWAPRPPSVALPPPQLQLPGHQPPSTTTTTATTIATTIISRSTVSESNQPMGMFIFSIAEPVFGVPVVGRLYTPPLLQLFNYSTPMLIPVFLPLIDSIPEDLPSAVLFHSVLEKLWHIYSFISMIYLFTFAFMVL